MANAELKIAGIPFAVWVQLVTTIATVIGAFSVVHTKLEIAARNIQELKQDFKDLKDQGNLHERNLGTIPLELKYLDRRITDLEAKGSRVSK